MMKLIPSLLSDTSIQVIVEDDGKQVGVINLGAFNWSQTNENKELVRFSDLDISFYENKSMKRKLSYTLTKPSSS